MKVAVCLSGEMRSSLKSYTRLKSHVIDPFLERKWTVDVYVVTRSDAWVHQSLNLLDAAIHPIRVRCLVVEENRPKSTHLIVSSANPKEAGEGAGELYQSYLQQYWSMSRVGKVLAQTEQLEGRYGLVVRSRPDCFLKHPLKVNDLMDGRVHVPWNDWWPYEVDGKRVETVCDKFAVGPSTDMQLYLNKFKQLQVFCEQYRLQGEAFTAWCLGGMRWHYDGERTPWVREEWMEVEHQLQDRRRWEWVPLLEAGER